MKGEKVTLTITGTGMDGEGVARLDNLAVFVDGALLGEKVEAIITLRKKSFARARIIKVLEKSPMRCQPLCPVYYRCGGCNLQHIKYAEQLLIKKNELMSCLKKQLRIDLAVDDVVPSDIEFGYRNKLQLPIGEDDKGNIVAGFYRDNSHTIVPITTCPLHGEWADDIISAVVHYATIKKISAYNEAKNTGILRHLVVRRIGEKFAIVLVINSDRLPHNDYLIKLLNNTLEGRFSLHYSVNKLNTNVIMGDNLHLLHGDDRVKADVLGLTVKVSPFSFMQVNDYIRDRIYTRVADMVEGHDRIVIDAYSGAGTLTALVARKAAFAIGIEIVPEAVADADTLMLENNLSDKVINICGDIKDILPKLNLKELYNLTQSKNEDSVVSDNLKGRTGKSIQQDKLMTNIVESDKDSHKTNLSESNMMCSKQGSVVNTLAIESDKEMQRDLAASNILSNEDGSAIDKQVIESDKEMREVDLLESNLMCSKQGSVVITQAIDSDKEKQRDIATSIQLNKDVSALDNQSIEIDKFKQGKDLAKSNMMCSKQGSITQAIDSNDNQSIDLTASNLLSNENSSLVNFHDKVVRTESTESIANVTLILDPPRKGCDSEVITAILSINPSQIIYISCNPATLARDLALLTKSNTYAINTITPYDMFPQTSHVETLCCLTRKV